MFFVFKKEVLAIFGKGRLRFKKSTAFCVQISPTKSLLTLSETRKFPPVAAAKLCHCSSY